MDADHTIMGHQTGLLPAKQESLCESNSSDVEVEKDVDVEEFSDAENVSAASSSRSPAPSDEDDDELIDEDEEDDGKSSKCSSQKQQSLSSSKDGNKKKSKKKSKEPVNHLIKPRCNCEELMAVDCQLETKELWDKFHELGTEMIITKTGR